MAISSTPHAPEDLSWSEASASKASNAQAEFSSTDDAVDLYLNEIGRVPRIDHADEIELSRAVQDKLKVDKAREELRDRLQSEPADEQVSAYLGIDVAEMNRHLHRGDRAHRGGGERPGGEHRRAEALHGAGEAVRGALLHRPRPVR